MMYSIGCIPLFLVHHNEDTHNSVDYCIAVAFHPMFYIQVFQSFREFVWSDLTR